ncbi:hypothetical protein K438DRAFT_1804390 [Mycena galopus ATCC 62051]|nr:hypothetical protein K438DRAFT_1804390 [Mycena galopus ATCC 62051]
MTYHFFLNSALVFVMGVLTASAVVDLVENDRLASLVVSVTASLSASLLSLIPSAIVVNIVVLDIVLAVRQLRKMVPFKTSVECAPLASAVRADSPKHAIVTTDSQDTAGVVDSPPVDQVEFMPGGYLRESSIKDFLSSAPLVAWMIFIGWSTISCSMAVLVWVLAREYFRSMITSNYWTLLFAKGNSNVEDKHGFLSSEAKANNDLIDLDDKADKVEETDSAEGADLTLVDKSEEAATPDLPAPKASLDPSAPPFVPSSAQLAVHDVIPSPPSMNVKWQWQPTRPLSFLWTRGGYPTLIMTPSSTPLNPASPEFFPKARKPIVDENSAPSPASTVAPVPIKQEIVFRRAPPSFWAPGRAAIRVCLSLQN